MSVWEMEGDSSDSDGGLSIASNPNMSAFSGIPETGSFPLSECGERVCSEGRSLSLSCSEKDDDDDRS